MRLTKGHGTQNDFLLLEDLDNQHTLTPDAVRSLCDRRAGIGADGVLRVVRSEADPESRPMAAQGPYFMDYRNADGSLAEMCGNGVRVFVRYLHGRGLIGAETAVATRGGVRAATLHDDGRVTVAMGSPSSLDARPTVSGRPGHALQIPNPHVVVSLASVEELDGLDLREPPVVEPPLPQGQNVEFVVRLGSRRLRMRVHERGSGETFSCGTGICAVAVAIAAAEGAERDGSTWTVEVRGGVCEVTWRPDGEVLLTGPAVLVGEVEVDDAWLMGT